MTKREFILNIQKRTKKYDDDLKKQIIDFYKSKFKEIKKNKESINNLISDFNVNKQIKEFKKEYKKKKNQMLVKKIQEKYQKIKNILFIKRRKKKFIKTRKKNTTLKDSLQNNIREVTNNIQCNKRKISTAGQILLNILLILLLFLLLWLGTIFTSTLYAFLDGVKFIGIEIALFSICFIVLLSIIILNKYLNKEYFSKKKVSLLYLISLIVFTIGLGISLYDYYKCEIINNVNDKYQYYKRTESFNLPSNKEKKYYVYFNSWYKTKYNIEINNELEDQIKIEVRYYESYYDYYVKREASSAYISLNKNQRDLISMYLENLRDKKIYSARELSRYSVKIYVNEKDKNRLIVSY